MPENHPTLKSIVIAKNNGKSFSLRILLPPNIDKTAERNAIVVKVEAIIENEIVALEKINRGWAYRLDAPYFICAMMLEHWCNGRFKSMLQLSRQQLRELIQPLQNLPAIFMLKNPQEALVWENGIIPSIHKLLEDPVKIPEKKKEEIKILEAPKLRIAEDDLTPLAVDGSPNFLAISLPSRESVVYADAKEILREHAFKLEPSNRKWWLLDRDKTLNFLAQYWTDLREKYNAKFSDRFLKETSNISLATIDSHIKQNAKDYTLHISLSSPGIDESVFNESLARGKMYAEQNGKIAFFTKEQVEKIASIQRKLQETPDATLAPCVKRTVSNAEIENIYDAISEMAENIILPEEWQSRIKAFKDISQLQPAPLGKEQIEMLRPYQRIGVAWMWKHYQHNLGGILADEMGLGKTLQALTLINCVLKNGENKTALIICPASLVLNWKREATKFFPSIKIHLHYGQNRSKDTNTLQDADILITSYTTFTRDQNLLTQIPYSVAIADEAQHIKNAHSKNAGSLKHIQTNSRFVLTGTPIENSMDDLRSIFNFIMPGYLVQIPNNTKKSERSWYNTRTQEQVVPYILRRTKKAVAPELPNKIEQTIFCEMSQEQAALYAKTKEATQKEIFDLEMSNASEGKIRMTAFKQLLRLRQICADPRLVDENQLAENSSKLTAFLEILDEALDGEHRILVFSPFVSLLKLLCNELEERNVPYAYLDGKTKNRLEECDRFNNDSSIPVFLISLKAGGVGLNLTGADTVIHFDPWWNPAVEDQATDRAHRIGQNKVVTSIKLIIANTVEEKVLDLQKQKAQLLHDLFEANEEITSSFGMEEIKELMA
jgi:superfamily II DNA or RNA helicase